MPEMTPDLYGLIDIAEDNDTVTLTYEPIANTYKQIITPKEISFDFKYNPCICALCRNSWEKVGFKKAIKWNSKMYNYYKKILKRLNDSKTYDNVYKSVGEMMLFHKGLAKELRKQRKNKEVKK